MLAGKGPGSDRDKVHEFLDQYYEESIQTVRQILPEEFPVVLFSWIYNFDRWESNRFPSEQYGKVVWDTHIYTWSQHNHKPVEDLEEVLSYYNKALMKIQKFQKDQNTSVLVGEFTLANLDRDENDTEAWQEYADRIYDKMKEVVQSGALLWNFDCNPCKSWSMKDLHEVMGVEWNL